MGGGLRAAAALGIALGGAWLLWPAGGQPGPAAMLVAVLLVVLPVLLVQLRTWAAQRVPAVVPARPASPWVAWAAVCLAGAVLLGREVWTGSDLRGLLAGDCDLLFGGIRSLTGYLVLLGWSAELLLGTAAAVAAAVLRGAQPPAWSTRVPLLPLALVLALVGPEVWFAVHDHDRTGGIAIFGPAPDPGPVQQARAIAVLLLLVPPVLASAAWIRRRASS